MDKYYYFATELPYLRFEKLPFITKEYFLQEAEKWLEKKDFPIICALDKNGFSDGRSGPRLLREYKQFEYTLSFELSLFRKAQKDQTPHRLPPILRDALQDKNPLEQEKNLLRRRWNYIEEKEEGHYFDLSFFICYFLKLKILQRLYTFDKEKGKNIFKSFCAKQYG